MTAPGSWEGCFGEGTSKGCSLERVHQGYTKASLRCNAHTFRELHALRGEKVQGVPFFKKTYIYIHTKNVPLSPSAVNIQFSRVSFRKKGYTPTQMPFLSRSCIRQVLVTQGIAERVSLGAPLVYPWCTLCVALKGYTLPYNMPGLHSWCFKFLIYRLLIVITHSFAHRNP